MIGRRGRPDDALTGFGLVILTGIVISAVIVAWLVLSGTAAVPVGREFPEGIVPGSMYLSGDGIQPVGSATGFSSLYLGQVRTPVVYRNPDPGRLGSVQLTVSLFMGDTGAIDTDRITVTWSSNGSVEHVTKTREILLVCPYWTITGKYNMLPGRTADSDEWLEPGEQFQVIVCPKESLAPYHAFTLGMYPDGMVIPLRLSRMVPPRVRPVMDLG